MSQASSSIDGARTFVAFAGAGFRLGCADPGCADPLADVNQDSHAAVRGDADEADAIPAAQSTAAIDMSPVTLPAAQELVVDGGRAEQMRIAARNEAVDRRIAAMTIEEAVSECKQVIEDYMTMAASWAASPRDTETQLLDAGRDPALAVGHWRHRHEVDDQHESTERDVPEFAAVDSS